MAAALPPVVPVHLLLPLLASWVYVAGALLVKRSADFGVGVYRTTFVANLTMGVCFLPLWLLGGQLPPGALFWQPLVTAVLFITGQLLTFHSLNHGDVSIATPVLGVKIILVAFFTTLILREPVPLTLWFSAGLSVAAIGLLNRRDGVRRQGVGGTVLTAGGAAVVYALFDVLVQKWSPGWGGGRYLPVMMAMVAVLSCVFIPLFHAPLRAVPRPAWPWLLGGSLCLAGQASLFISTLAVYGQATAANIVYSSRGLWSVVAVWWIGHWFRNQEQHLAPGILRSRLAGALLMLAAILLVLL